MMLKPIRSVVVLLGLVMSLLTVTPSASAAPYTTNITNFNASGQQVTRFDTAGNAVDAHDGELVKFGSTYYLYGTSYNCGFNWQTPGAPFCGFKSYSSTDLVHWTDQGALFDASGSLWQSRCNGSTYGCYRPHVVYNPGTAKYVLWVNVYDNQNGFRVFTSDSPTGPFAEVAEPTLAVNNDAPVGGLNNGDHDTFVDDDGTGYLVYTDWRAGGDLVVEQLTSDYLTGTGSYLALGQVSTEAPAMFKRAGTYYLTYSDPNCGYCITGTSYKTASNPLGPWSAGTNITTDSCGGQPAFVTPIETTTGTTYLYGSDLWNGAPNEGLANYYWAPLNFTGGGAISPLACQNSFSLNLADGSAGSQVLPADVDQHSGVTGFGTYCDIGISENGNLQRFQTFVPSRSGTLSALSFTSFQAKASYPPAGVNAGLKLSIYQANEDHQPTGVALSTTTVSASSIGWSARNITVAPNIPVTVGVRYGVKISSATTSGCYGMSYNNSSPYPGGGATYSINGSPFGNYLETGRSLKFSTSVS